MSVFRRNLVLICVFHALHMALFPVAILTLYFKFRMGFGMTEIMILQAYFGIIIALSEFPCGVISDRLGYRVSLLFATLIAALGWSIYASVDSFLGILCAETFLGIGLSLISGTDSAILYESLKRLGDEVSFTKWQGRMVFCGQLAEGSAALLAAILYAWNPRSPFVIEVFIWLANFGIAFMLVNPVDISKNAWKKAATVKYIVRYVFVESRTLRKLVIFSLVLSMSSFIPIWLIQIYAQESGVTTVWLGAVWAAANYSVAIGALFSHRFKASMGINRCLWLCALLVAVGYAGLGFTHHLLAFGFYFFLTLMRGINTPILIHERQRRTPTENRVAMLSLQSLLFRLSFTIIGPVVGLSVDHVGQHTTFLIVGIILVPLIVYRLIRLQPLLEHHNESELR